jgi:hypothetical protein
MVIYRYYWYLMLLLVILMDSLASVTDVIDNKKTGCQAGLIII